MPGIFESAVNLVRALARREPGMSFGGTSNGDWLPPVVGPSDWPIGLMSDTSAAWYFDRRYDENR